MGADSKIEWTHHTMNPWWGCQRVSPGCEHCYAETFSKRVGLKLWGPEKTAPRRFFGDKHWAEPLKWNANAAKRGVRERVFCASMADVFEDRDDLAPHRARLFELIEATPSLDWLLLTKRPENVGPMWPIDLDTDDVMRFENVWLGTTCEDQQRADARIPHLLCYRDRAAKLFVSYEPALGPIDFEGIRIDHGEGVRHYVRALTGKAAFALDGAMHPWAVENHLDWIIVGGESGPGARPFNVAWARSTIEQCRAAGVPVFVKQLGPHPFERAEAWGDDAGGYDPRNLLARADAPRPPQMEGWTRVRTATETAWYRYHRVKDRKGGDWSEWPEDLRVREYPDAG